MGVSKLNIEHANKLLVGNLRSLESELERKKQETLAQSINDILYTAIETNPIEVNAVQIETSIDITRPGEGFPSAHPIFSGRSKLENFLKTYFGTEDLPSPVKITFNMHLPYSFTTGTHGSGQRKATGASWENMMVNLIVQHVDEPPSLTVNIGSTNFISREEAYFFLGEVRGIKFTKIADCEYTPFLKKKSSCDYELKQPHSSAKHYISYRGFYTFGLKDDDVPDKSWKDDVKAIMREVWIPDYSTDLFKKVRIRPLYESFSGFAFFEQDKAILYEFDGFSIPISLRESNNAILAAYAIITHNKHPQSNIKTYEGDKVIERLYQIEPQRDLY